MGPGGSTTSHVPGTGRRSLLPTPSWAEGPLGKIWHHDPRAIPWCSGYHVCFTRRRSPVRSRAGSRLSFADGRVGAASSRLSNGSEGRQVRQAEREKESQCTATRLCPSRTPWRNGSASDSRSEGCVFKSRRGQCPLMFLPPAGVTHSVLRSLALACWCRGVGRNHHAHWE